MKLTKGLAVGAAVAGLLLMTAFASNAWSQEQIDETRKVDADASISIGNVSGSVTLIGWDRSEVHITGSLGEDVEDFIVDGGGNYLEIRVEIEEARHSFFGKGRRQDYDTDLEIHLPKGCRVEVSSVSADVEASKLENELTVETVSGDISAQGEMKEVSFSSISGEIELTASAEMVEVSTISGDVLLEDVRGDLEVETVSGDVRVVGGTFSRLRFESVSGDLRFLGDFDKNGSYSFSCHSGTIELQLPSDVDAEFEVSTFSGHIDNEFGSDGRRTSKWTPGRELHFTTGSGDASVRIETFSGDVLLEKR